MSEDLGLYVHIPFCERRCPYCAFYSTAGAAAEEIVAYPRYLLREMDLREEDWRGFSLRTIYIGGGTPSLLEPDAIACIIEGAKSRFNTADEIEITLECNPGTVTPKDLEDYVNAGVNRLSIGVQSFDDSKLEFLGRIHNAEEALQILTTAKSEANIVVSADLIVGTPQENQETWDRELEALFEHRPHGLSFYGLTVEEGTDLARRATAQEKVYLPADETVDLLTCIAARLRDEGYRHYEVSNWALPGSESRHNLHYWKRGKYVGLGPSAHSCDGTHRYWNIPDIKAYGEAIDQGSLPPSEAEYLDDQAIRTEWVYLSLRLDEGLNFKDYRDNFGEIPPYWQVMFEKIAAAGLGDFDGIRFRPNDRGLLLADEIAARILG